MTLEKSREALLDFFHDRGVFARGKKIQGMAVSRKPLLFVDYYASLPASDRNEMNDHLMSVFLGNDRKAKKFIPGVGMILTAILERVRKTGLEAYQPELIGVLRDPQNRDVWMHQTDYNADFQKDWRYAIAIMNVLKRLRTPRLQTIMGEMASKARSRLFRKKLVEITRNS